MAKSSKPTGLKITRDGNKFVCEWKQPSGGYEKQYFKATTLGSVEVGKSTEKKTVTIDLSERHPVGSKKLTVFNFSVKGKQKNKDMSDWQDIKSHDIHPPKKPSVSREDSGTNKTKFSWTVSATEDSAWFPFYRVSVYTALVKDCTYAPSSAPNSVWTLITTQSSLSDGATISRSGYNASHGGYKASGYIEFTESSAVLATGNHTRMMKLVAQGCGGDTIAYSSRVYGSAKEAQQGDGEVNETSAGYDIVVNWDTAYDKSCPIDETTVQWTMAKPNADMSCPAGASWTDGATIKDTPNSESVHIQIDQALGEDQCLYTRVNTKHDSNITYGAARLQKVGKLKSPSITVTSTSQENQTVSLTATQASEVSGAKLAIIYNKNGSETIIGLLNGTATTTLKCPAWASGDTVTFGVRAVLPKSSSSTTDDGVTIYTIESYMESDLIWQGGAAATAPGSISLSKSGDDVLVRWTNSWSDATGIELSWSENPNAWESTDQPDTFEIDNPFITSWRISGLETGTTWYVKVRSLHSDGSTKSYSPFSPIAEINLSSSPSIPTLALSADIVAVGKTFTASWEYGSTDGTPQSEARIYTYDSGTYTLVARTSTQEYVDLTAWDVPGVYQLCVEVISASGQMSEKSGFVGITVADPVTCSMVNSLEDITVTDDDMETRTIRALTELPLTATVTGASLGGTVSLTIARTDAYHLGRPDESVLDGFNGEIILDYTQTGSAQISIDTDDLIGSLDEGGKYILTATVTDSIGQSASASEEFEVHWTDPALIPEGEMLMDVDARVAVITPVAPQNALVTDTIDIYRLSADKPVLVYEGAEFGSEYVDPYPAIGRHGGYRLVYRTKEKNYVTANGELAFTDLQDDILDCKKTIIDFGTDRVELQYNMDFTSSWAKNFETKSFLGGSIKGYWREGVTRSGSVSAVAVPAYDTEIVEAMRRLSEYVGRCHVRTPEGSSYTADVQCQEDWAHDQAGKIVSFSLAITRVDQAMDGMTYEEFIGEQ
jgi:hypothetical protein